MVTVRYSYGPGNSCKLEGIKLCRLAHYKCEEIRSRKKKKKKVVTAVCVKKQGMKKLPACVKLILLKMRRATRRRL